MKLNATTMSIRNVKRKVYVTVSNGNICTISELKDSNLEPVVSLTGYPCIILWGSREGLLVSAGESLYLVSEGEARIVLRTGSGKWFWHATEGCSKVFVHEYCNPATEGACDTPTGIYVTEDFKKFERVATNRDVDPTSKHFHIVAFDRSRGILISTLGDANIVRVAISSDCGFTWRPLYKGPWQFVPVLVEGSRWIFGFDSGVARGGIAVYDIEANKWSFTFLKSEEYRYTQFTSIVKFNNYYVSCLGYPTAITVSKDLLHWYPLHIDRASTHYNHIVDASVYKDRVVAVTGKELLIYDTRDIEEAFRKKPFLAPYKAYLDKARGFVYVLKRLPWMLEL